jgi:hypothetical protein
MRHQGRFRRFGQVTTVVSATTIALVVLGGPSAYAEGQCKKGTDPKTTLENWKCQWDGLWKPKKPATPPKKPATPAKPNKPNKPAKPKAKALKAPPARRGGASTPAIPQVPAGSTSTASRPGGLQPYNPNSAPELPGLLPAPQVAGDATAYDRSAPLPETHLISPVAATQPAGKQMLWVAIAAATAGAVGTMNLTVLSRRRRV